MVVKGGTNTALLNSECVICFRLLSKFHLPKFLFCQIVISLSYSTLVREVSHVQDDAVFLIGKGVGGYLASMMMAHDEEDLFKCAAVISPVIDFMQYGERFSSSPISTE